MIEIVRSILKGNSVNVLIKNICSVLERERRPLFIYDKSSDQLIVYKGGG